MSYAGFRNYLNQTTSGPQYNPRVNNPYSPGGGPQSTENHLQDQGESILKISRNHCNLFIHAVN